MWDGRAEKHIITRLLVNRVNRIKAQQILDRPLNMRPMQESIKILYFANGSEEPFVEVSFEEWPNLLEEKGIPECYCNSHEFTFSHWCFLISFPPDRHCQSAEASSECLQLCRLWIRGPAASFSRSQSDPERTPSRTSKWSKDTRADEVNALRDALDERGWCIHWCKRVNLHSWWTTFRLGLKVIRGSWCTARRSTAPVWEHCTGRWQK